MAEEQIAENTDTGEEPAVVTTETTPIDTAGAEEEEYTEEQAEADFAAAAGATDENGSGEDDKPDTGTEQDTPKDTDGEESKPEEEPPKPTEEPKEEPEEEKTPAPKTAPTPAPQVKIDTKVLSGKDLIEALKDTVIDKDENGEDIKLGDFAKEYPSVIAAVDAVLDKKLEPIKALVEAQAAAKAELDEMREMEKARDELEAALPGARAIVASKEFEEWFGKQSAAVQNLGYSPEVGDSKILLEMYKSQHPTAAPEPKRPSIRKQILAAGRSTGSKSVAKTPENDDLSEEEERALFEQACK